MPFITKYNHIRIIKNINPQDSNFEGEVYKSKIYFLSKYEEQELLAYREFIENPEEFLELYERIEKREDTFTRLYEGMKPAYHKSEQCQNLNSSYSNFKIPQEIQDRGAEAVLKYRAWIKDNPSILDNKEIFEMRHRSKYIGVTVPEIIEKNNSGTEFIENYDISEDELEKEIDALIKAAGRFYYESNKNTNILKPFSRYSFLAYSKREIRNNDTGYSDFEVKELLKQYSVDYKDPIKEKLRDWYRIKFNPNFDFDGTFLEQLGFSACKNCFDDD